MMGALRTAVRVAQLAAWVLASGSAAAACPTGTSFNTTLGFCADSTYAYGPFTQSMVSACTAGGNGSVCTATLPFTVNGVSVTLPRWTRTLTSSLRGKKTCPTGSAANASYDNLCAETVGNVTQVFSNFGGTLLDRCTELGKGAACQYNRWEGKFYKTVAFKQSLQNALNSSTARANLPSVAVSVLTPDQGMVPATVGVAAPGAGPVDTSLHRYRFGSVSKNVTAATVMKLAELGMLNIDDKLAQHLVINGLPNGNIITIRQLLNHSAGVGDYLNSSNAFLTSTNDPTHIYTDAEIVGYINAMGAQFTPGSQYSYSNGNFYILSMLVEAKTGLPLDQAVRQYVTQPMGLNNLLVDLSSSSTSKLANLVESSRAYAYSTTSVKGAGAVAATPNDMATYMKKLYGSTFLTNGSIAAMQAPSANSTTYGLGTIIWSSLPYYGHTGTLLNYKSVAYYIPGMGTSVAITTNDYPSDATWTGIRDAILNVVTGTYTGYCGANPC